MCVQGHGLKESTNGAKYMVSVGLTETDKGYQNGKNNAGGTQLLRRVPPACH